MFKFPKLKNKLWEVQVFQTSTFWTEPPFRANLLLGGPPFRGLPYVQDLAESSTFLRVDGGPLGLTVGGTDLNGAYVRISPFFGQMARRTLSTLVDRPAAGGTIHHELVRFSGTNS